MKDINELKRELFDAIESICKDYEKPAEPLFKVGQWVIGINGAYPETPGRIIKVQEDYCNYGVNNYSDYHYHNVYLSNQNSRLATPSEIGAHLRKIMEQKGFKKGVKYCDVFGNTVTIKGTPRYFYDESCDMLGIEGIDPPHNDVVYWLGKFAEIIPDKKPLPKTREEFKEFIHDFWDSIPDDTEYSLSIDDFLNQYES